ncbi:MAG: hypothetical protein J6K17_10535 [Oscillospiraceae bacterium]|nr:hypothetical protein [Oscillospiraceae bacterium]
MNIQTEENIAIEQQPAASTKTNKSMPAAVRVILCILLSTLFLVTVVASSAIVVVKKVITRENIEKILDNTDYMTIPLEIDNIQSNLYEMFFIAFANNSTKKVDIYELAEDTEFEKMIAGCLYDYVSFVLYDDKLDEIDDDIIKDFYDDNSKTIDRAFNITLSRNDIYEIIDEQDDIFDKLSDKEIEKSVPYIELIRFAMSPAALIILGVTAAILLILIGIVSRSVGTPLVITGVFASIIGLAGIIAAYLAIFGVIGIAAAPVTTASVIWQGVVSALVPSVTVLFVYILTGGILLILTGGFIGKIRRNIKRAKTQ